MRSRLLSACVAAAVVSGFLSASPQAAAETVTLGLTQAPNGFVNVTLDTRPINAAPQGPLYWTQTNPITGLPINAPPNTNFPPPTTTFCIELFPDTSITPYNPADPLNTTYTFGVTDPANAPTIKVAGDAATAAKVNAIYELYDNKYNLAWNNNAFPGSIDSRAFQLALWELVYDGPNAGNTDSLSDGRFRVDGTVPGFAEAQAWLNNDLGGTFAGFTGALANYELVALVAPAGQVDPDSKLQTPGQDQLTLRPKGVVPAPPGVILAGIGIVGLVGRSRWLRRKPVAA